MTFPDDGEARALPSELSADSADGAAIPLAVWRLLDWRFLLPVLGPFRFAFSEGVPADLREALVTADPLAHRFDPQVAIPDNLATPLIIVLSSPTRSEFETAARYLRPGDFVYAQLTRKPVVRSVEPRSIWGWERLAVRLGIGPVRLFWHAPDFQRCARIVPLDSRSAVWNTLQRHRGIRWGRAKSELGKLAFRLGLFGLAVPEASLLLSRPGQIGTPADAGSGQVTAAGGEMPGPHS